jgi:beta-lactamase class A
MIHNKYVQAWCVRGETGAIISSQHADVVQPGASLGKILVLIEVARGIVEGSYPAGHVLERPSPVADSGLWQHFDAQGFTIVDCCRLVGAVSDNMAANALIDFIGIEAVMVTREKYLPECETLEIFDRVRDVREPQHPQELSIGSTRDWSLVMHNLSVDAVISPHVSHLVRDWLSLSTDHSLVLAPLCRDPLVSDVRHQFNKTGTDLHVRADVGWVNISGRKLSYAACVSSVTSELDAVHFLRSIGDDLITM